jgi:hypothetical protein
VQVNSSQWYVRWFLWNCMVLDRWWNSEYVPMRARRAMEHGTDLCTFFRTILLGTVVAALNLGIWLYMVGVFLVAPFLLFNVTTVAMSVAVVLGIVAAIFALATAVVFAVSATQWLGRKARVAAHDAPSAAPSFLQVFGRYLVGIKQRFCPTITIQEKRHD